MLLYHSPHERTYEASRSSHRRRQCRFDCLVPQEPVPTGDLRQQTRLYFYD